MKAILAVLALIATSSVAIAQTNSRTESDLILIAQELYDALPSGNRAVWEKYVADDVIYTDENWRILTKKQLLESISPLPKGYSGSIRMENIQSRVSGNAAVLSYRVFEVEHVFGQKLSPVYLVTDTYFKRDGRWQMIASHVIVLPGERKPVALNPKSYQSIIGEYELTPGVTYTINLEGGKLIGQRSGRSKEEFAARRRKHLFREGNDTR